MKRQKKCFGFSLGQALFPNCLSVRLGFYDTGSSRCVGRNGKFTRQYDNWWHEILRSIWKDFTKASAF